MSEKQSAIARARAAWGDALPDWVAALAKACDQASLTSAAQRSGYSAATLSYVINNRYAGDLGAVAKAVRGAFMDVKVECPVFGAIGGDRCLQYQRQPYSNRNPQSVWIFRACRSGCPHSRLPKMVRS